MPSEQRTSIIRNHLSKNYHISSHPIITSVWDFPSQEEERKGYPNISGNVMSIAVLLRNRQLRKCVCVRVKQHIKKIYSPHKTAPRTRRTTTTVCWEIEEMDRLGVDSSRKAPVSNYRRLKLFDGCFRAREKLYLADRSRTKPFRRKVAPTVWNVATRWAVKLLLLHSWRVWGHW